MMRPRGLEFLLDRNRLNVALSQVQRPTAIWFIAQI